MAKKRDPESAGDRGARAAAVRAERARAERRRNLSIGGAVVVVLLLVIGVGWAVQANRDTTGETAEAPAASTSAGSAGSIGPAGSAAEVAPAETYGLGVGNPDAPVKVEVFEDFLCPFCGQYEAASRAQLRQDAADGKVYLVYRPIAFLNEYSARALNAFAVVLNTAGPEAALKFHDLLYEDQPSETGAMPDNDWLVQKAVEAGAAKAKVTKGIESGQYQQWITNGADDASKRGVQATPTVFADGQPVQGRSMGELVTKTQQVIDDGQ